MNVAFTFKPEPFEAYSERELHQLEEEFGNFGGEMKLDVAWRRVRPAGGVYAIFKNGKLQYIGVTDKLGGSGNRLYRYWWYAKSLGCDLSGHTVRVRHIADKAARESLENTLRQRLNPPGNILEIEDVSLGRI